MKNKHNYPESGFTMIGVLIIFAIITVLGFSIVTLSFASVKTSTSERNNQSAFYIAEAGLTYQMEKAKNEAITIYESDLVKKEDDFSRELETLVNESIIYDDFEKINGVQPYAEISIELISESANHFSIESTGKIGEEERTVSSSFTVDWVEKYTESEGEPYELPPFAVFTAETLKMNNGTINGDIGTVSQDKGAISFPGGGPTHNGSIFVQDGDEDIVNNRVNNIKSEIKSLDNSYLFPELPVFPVFPPGNSCPEDEEITLSNGNKHEVIKNCSLYINNYVVRDSNYKLVMDSNLKFTRMYFNQNYNLTIVVGNSDRSIVVDHLDLTNGHIKLEGNGKLTIYVTGKITMGSGSTINNNGDVAKLDVYLKGSGPSENRKKVTLSGSQKVFGSLYAEDADISLQNGGGFFGNIFTGGNNFKISGGSYNQAQLFFAPHAFFDMESGGTKFDGMIIADSYSISGGWNVTYKELKFTDGPISPSALSIGTEGGSGGGTSLEPTGASPTITTTPPREK